MDRGTLIKHWRWETDKDGLAWLTFDKQGESANTFSREALEELSLSLKEIKAASPKGRDNFWNGAQEVPQARRAPIQVYINKSFPGVHHHWHQSVFRSFKIADAFKLDHTFQRAIDSVSPTVIGTAELFCAALRFGDHRGGMMPANVVESSQLAVLTPRDDDRLSRKVRGKEISVFSHLVGAPHNLPSFREHALLFEFVDVRIEVPR